MMIREFLLNKIIKKLRSHDHRYWLWRGLLTPFIDTEYNKRLYYSIADWIYSQEEGRLVYNYDFTDIFYLNGVVYLYVMRPGKWIGKYGIIIDDLLLRIKTEISECKEIKIIEDRESVRVMIFTRLSMRALDY